LYNQKEANKIEKSIGIALGHLLISRENKIYYINIKDFKDGNLKYGTYYEKYFSIEKDHRLM